MHGGRVVGSSVAMVGHSSTVILVDGREGAPAGDPLRRALAALPRPVVALTGNGMTDLEAVLAHLESS